MIGSIVLFDSAWHILSHQSVSRRIYSSTLLLYAHMYIHMISVRSSRGSLGVLPNLLYSTEKWIYIAFMEISSKSGSQKAPKLPLDLTLHMIGSIVLLAHS